METFKEEEVKQMFLDFVSGVETTSYLAELLRHLMNISYQVLHLDKRLHVLFQLVLQKVLKLDHTECTKAATRYLKLLQKDKLKATLKRQARKRKAGKLP